MLIFVDGVRHTQESLRRLNLQPDDIESIEVLKCTDHCEYPSTVIIRLKPTRQ